jgi:ATP/maltotriose-dependent transcriptional regulator MalT
MMELPARVAWAARTGASLSSPAGVQSPERDLTREQAMAGIETAVEAARRYIIKRPRLTRLLDNANARALMLIAPAGFGKTTLAREWVAERPHVWYRGTTAAADVAALLAGLSKSLSEVIPEAGVRAVNRMRATGTAEQDVDVLADLFAQDLTDWPEDTWLVFDDYQFAMEARAPERLIDLLLRKTSIRMVLTSRKRPTWATARRLLYGEVYELGRTDLAMDHDEAAEVLSHRKDAPAAGLVALAEGWPAVIGLAALTDEFNLPEGGLPHALYDYFAEELFQAAEPDIQEGLCRLALAPSLGEGVAEFLLGNDAAEVISVGVRLGFLAMRLGNIELHPLLRAFLDTKTRELPGIQDDAKQLAFHLAEQGSWDDAFTLVELYFSERLFVEILELGLSTMLAEARTATLARWVELAEDQKVDSPIVDLAEAEMAFHQGDRRKSKALALRAARGFGDDHRMASRAYYIAGTSARMDYEVSDAGSYFARALSTATTASERRDAISGELVVSLDLGLPNASELFERLLELDDGTASSEARLAIARFIIGIRQGTANDLPDIFESASHVLPRLTEPHIVSSFQSCHAYVLAVLGRYDEALTLAARCEKYAKDVRLPFVVAHAKRVRAIAELGLRHFARARRLLDQTERAAHETGDIFIEVESRVIAARLLISQGLPALAIKSLADPPRRFPFVAERSEFLATLGLATACHGERSAALALAQEAAASAQTVEVRSLAACTRAICAISSAAADASDQAIEAIETVLATGGIDPFVTAYRGYPKLIATLAQHLTLRDALVEITSRAQDWKLAVHSGLMDTKRAKSTGAPLTHREREVVDLVAQGRTNKEIAQALFISESTAKVHVRHIMEKLSVHTRTEAALRALEITEPD